MQSNNRYLLYAAILIFGILCIYFLFSVFQSPYKYKYTEKGVVFLSKTADPVQLIHSFGDKSRVVLILDYSQASQLQLANDVLVVIPLAVAGNNKKSVVIIRTMNDSGVLKKCTTNKGDVSTEVDLNASACESYIRSLKDKYTGFIHFYIPNPAQKMFTVYVSESNIDIHPRFWQEVNGFADFIAQAIYSNVEDIKAKASSLLNKVQ